MPTNAKMPELKRAFERAGFTDVKTVLGGAARRDVPACGLRRTWETVIKVAR